MNKAITGLAIVATLGLARAAAADAAAGAALYTKKCATCHGKQGEGNPKMEKMLNVAIKPLSDKDVQAKSDDQLKKEMIEGVGKMKPVKGLTDTDAGEILLHVRSLAQ
jgi:cytochrome c5